MPLGLIASLLLQLVVGVALQVIGYLLMGQAKKTKPDTVKDLENPTAEAGRPIPVIFGQMEVTGVNVIFFGEKSTKTFQVSA